MAPPRPGTLAPGADGMTDAATANGDDRDPEIELFVKVGRRPGAAAPAAPPARLEAHVPGAPSALGRRTFPRERSPALTVPWVAFLLLRGSREGWSQVQSGRWLSSRRVCQAVCQTRRRTSRHPAPARFWPVLRGISRCREMAGTWLDP